MPSVAYYRSGSTSTVQFPVVRKQVYDFANPGEIDYAILRYMKAGK
jgi:hypothetical protein